MHFKLSSHHLLILMVVLCIADAVAGTFNIDFLISRSDIYYQQPIRLSTGAPNELPLRKVNDLTTKTNLKLIVHGFTGSRFHASITPLRNAYMAKGIENIFLADWSDAASLDYHSSRKAVGKVAKMFGKLLEDFIMRLDIDPGEVHIIGHSLGAHIAGGIGEYLNGTLGRITGLDPALPLFTPTSDDSLHATAAMFIDVIHTDYPVFGDITPRGTVDFYPDYGHTPQKGCDDFDLITASKLIFEAYSCSHNRAVLFYAESIGQPKNFPTLPCTLNAIKQRDVEVCLENSDVDKGALVEAIINMDNSQVVYMGENVSRSAFGIFYLDTYDAPPFGMGMNTRF